MYYVEKLYCCNIIFLKAMFSNKTDLFRNIFDVDTLTINPIFPNILYVLTLDDWLSFLKDVMERFPPKGIEIDRDNCPVWTNQVKGGKPYKGCGITVKDVIQHKEKWEKIERLLR